VSLKNKIKESDTRGRKKKTMAGREDNKEKEREEGEEGCLSTHAPRGSDALAVG